MERQTKQTTDRHKNDETLQRCDLIHSSLDANLVNTYLNDTIPVTTHDRRECILDRQCKFFLGFKDGIQFQSGKLRSHDFMNNQQKTHNDNKQE